MTPHDTPADMPEIPAVPALQDEDSRALDSLCEHQLDPAAVPQAHRDRAIRIASLLDLLGRTPIEGRAQRVARTMSCVRRSDESSTELCGQDAEALDAWVLAEFDAARVPPHCENEPGCMRRSRAWPELVARCPLISSDAA
ncbi:MAG: hypothetical protein IPJ41_09090 [Phycisphaerales bacterium]|nr:hypothetical protein [Phycisphaerales bacterium]